MEWLIARISEPSTHAGICALVSAAAHFWPEYAQAIIGVAALFGFGAIATREGGK